ncbi:MAG: Aconitate hydratase A [Pseudomonas fluorescens]|nr:MAG: Aconitate hydratase A [Pseudomonas fluorescens]
MDSFSCERPLPGFPSTRFLSLPAAEAAGAGPLSRLPYSLRVLAENLLRHQDHAQVKPADIQALARCEPAVVAFFPARILMQDSSGLPVLADFIALHDAVMERGGDGASVLPSLPMDLVVDHAVEVDEWGQGDALQHNLEQEFERHADRYRFLRWAQQRLPSLRVVPPGVGICHQLNLEVLASVVQTTTRADGTQLAGFDSLLGTDSHTTMINALSVFGWGVGGIEATAAALGEPVLLRVPEVVGVRLSGRLAPGVSATDLALSLTAILRQQDLVQRIVEFCGPGVATLAVPDRATVANMAPEYGATMGYFPSDALTLDYLRNTGRPEEQVQLVEAYLRAQHMLREADSAEPQFTRVVEFDLASVVPTVAGPSRPQDRLTLDGLPATVPAEVIGGYLDHGHVVIAAITSCTNTSNPRGLIAAGLLARNALARGLVTAPWTKTSFAPGSRVASRMLQVSGLQTHLDDLGFNVVGHGCMTCMGNSGPLEPVIEQQIREKTLAVAAVLSGNRNFEGRIHPSCRLSYLASPALVVAYALAGTMRIDLQAQPLGFDPEGSAVLLADLWPSDAEIDALLAEVDLKGLSIENRAASFVGPALWDQLAVPVGEHYPWDGISGFIRRPPFLAAHLACAQLDDDLLGARPLLVLGGSVTTDHISPVSRITESSEAGRWLLAHQVPAAELASFSARRLNHDVMLRGGFANPRIRNLMVPGSEGGVTRLMPDGLVMPVHEAARVYQEREVPLLVFAGKGYGAGSARDWAAKVTRLLGVRAVIAHSFERIHRTNLVALGVLPLALEGDVELALDGSETFDIRGLKQGLQPDGQVQLSVWRGERCVTALTLRCRIETWAEADWLRHGGLMPKVLSNARHS